MWLSEDELLQDSDSWSSPPLVLLRDIHSHLITNCDCKDTSTPQSQPDARARVGRSQQDGDSKQQETNPLFLPHLTKFHETYHVWGEDSSNMTNIPFQHRVTMQILKHWQPFWDLKLTFAVSHRAEQLYLHTQQYIITTDEDSVLRTEMTNLESQEEDAPKRVLCFKPMSWLGQIRPHHRDEA